jgi:hypothetical protein
LKTDDLDRILLAEKPVSPSASFGAEVMSRIEAEASGRRPVSFPWVPFVLSLILLAVLGVAYLRSDPTLHSMYPLFYALSHWIASPGDPALRIAVLSAFASMLGTWILVWFSFRLAGPRR